jgi:choline dehydrogenase-like flavoprotein
MLQVTSELASAIERATLDAVGEAGCCDAIVIGAGAAGGLAAELLAEAGLRVLVLDAGLRAPFWRAPLKRTVSSALAALARPEIVRRLPPSLLWKCERAARLIGRVRQPVQSECYAWPSAPESFVDDRDSPYDTPDDRPFNWVRVRDLGGRMIVPLHGRQYYRHGPKDFSPDDGLSPRWPFAPDELDPWYEMVEGKLALSGRREGNPWAPDSGIAHIRAPTAPEAALIDVLAARFPAIQPVLGRYAPPLPSLARAAETGRLLCRTGAIVRHIEMDGRGRAIGATFYDRRARAMRTARAPLIFLCASTLESTRILLTSRSDDRPDGLGGASNALGGHLMDHVSIKVEGLGPDFGDEQGSSEQGPCIYLPRFDTRAGGGAASRGYGVRIYLSPRPNAPSYFVAVADSEMLPRADNRVTLSSRTDAWGMPTLHIDCRHSEGELARARAQAEALAELAEVAGVTLRGAVGGPAAPGSAIHECGAARMGEDPATSVLDPFNECWDAKGLFVTDGASFPSEGIQNPTLTILALTARACRRAVDRSGPG